MKKALRSILPAFVILTMLLAALPAHSVQAATPTDLYFSEYIEGSSNNKALEIYNGTGTDINLAANKYNVQMYFNGSASASLTINLTGTVVSGDVFVLAQSSANATILAQADQTNGSGWFNGDDAVVLRKDTVVLDVIGQIGFDPGTEWGSGLTSTADNTLRRKADICAGDPIGTDAFDPSIQWDGFATDTFDGLGAYAATCGTGPTNPSGIGAAVPSTLFTGDSVLLTLAVTGGTIPDSTGLAVSCDLSSIGGADNQAFFDDGTNGDVTLDDLTFSFETTVAAGTTGGAKSLACTITDAEARTGSATIALTVIPFLTIGELNGPVLDTDNGTKHESPYKGQIVAIQGVVYEKTLQAGASNPANGFFIQNTAATADGDPLTSDGLFVYIGKYDNIKGPDGKYHTPAVGDEIILEGKIAEYYNLTEMSGSLFLLGTVRTDVDIDAEVAPVVANPPADLADANRYWERLQGMRIQVPAGSVVLGGRSVFSPADAEIWVAAPDSTIAQRTDPYTNRAFRDAHPLDDNYNPDAWDGNGYRILMGSLGIKATAGDAQTLIDPARTFDTLTNAPAGGLNYTYSKYRIEISDQPTFAEGVDPSQNNPVQAVADRTTAYSIVDYNLENLYDYRDNPFSGCDFAGNPGCPISGPFLDAIKPAFNYVPASEEAYQARLADIATQIINDLHAPDVLMLQEVENQDFCTVVNGAMECDITKNNADGKPDVLQDLALKIAALGGPSYDAAYDPDSSDLRGILPAYLYRTDRVELLPAAGDPILGTTPAIAYAGAGVPANSDISNPKTLNADLPDGISACETSWVFPRAPDIALFRIYSDSVGVGIFTDVYTIDNHFKSGPDSCVAHRTEQAKYNAAIVSYIESVNPFAKVVTGGDLNVYPEPDNTSINAPKQLDALYDPALGLKNLWEVMLAEAPASAYSYVYMGMAQTLDQMFVNQPLLATMQDYKIAHINSDFPADYAGDVARGTSDHDPNAATFTLNQEYSGFVTGGGWFMSPVDGYKAKFDIAAKYKMNSSDMTGDTVLELGKDMILESTGYDWLMQVADTALLKGSGTINGAGEYYFIITMKEGSPDQIKIMIWDASGIVYDTGSLVDIGNGSIMFH